MRVPEAREIAKELWQSVEEDIIVTCEGIPEDIDKVRAQFRKIVEKSR